LLRPDVIFFVFREIEEVIKAVATKANYGDLAADKLLEDVCSHPLVAEQKPGWVKMICSMKAKKYFATVSNFPLLYPPPQFRFEVSFHSIALMVEDILHGWKK
jgi:hypothetical protein